MSWIAANRTPTNTPTTPAITSITNSFNTPQAKNTTASSSCRGIPSERGSQPPASIQQLPSHLRTSSDPSTSHVEQPSLETCPPRTPDSQITSPPADQACERSSSSCHDDRQRIHCLGQGRPRYKQAGRRELVWWWCLRGWRTCYSLEERARACASCSVQSQAAPL